MDKLKTYIVEVVIKKYGPKIAAGIMSYGITFIVAHQEFLESLGITYYPDFDGTWHGAMPTGRLLIVEFDTLTIWGGAMVVAGIMAAVAWFQHHGQATVTGQSQSGDQRQTPTLPIEGGQRKEDQK